jgi:hypothetical protein
MYACISGHDGAKSGECHYACRSERKPGNYCDRTCGRLSGICAGCHKPGAQFVIIIIIIIIAIVVVVVVVVVLLLLLLLVVLLLVVVFVFVLVLVKTCVPLFVCVCCMYTTYLQGKYAHVCAHALHVCMYVCMWS